MQLTKSERKQLSEAGMTNARCIEERIDRNGYVEKLISATSRYDERMYGWWGDGDGAKDIRWSREKANA